MVDCTLYVKKFGKDKWDRIGSGTAQGKESALNHAERKLHINYKSVNIDQEVFLFVQDEFPCDQCKSYFINVTHIPIIFLCLGSTTYAGDWGFNSPPPMPQAIYIYNGTFEIPGFVRTTDWQCPAPDFKPVQMTTLQIKSITAPDANAPKNFPRHPPLDQFF